MSLLLPLSEENRLRGPGAMNEWRDLLCVGDITGELAADTAGLNPDTEERVAIKLACDADGVRDGERRAE